MRADAGSIQTHTGTGRRRAECAICDPVWHSPEREAGTPDAELEVVLAAHMRAVHGFENVVCQEDGRRIT